MMNYEIFKELVEKQLKDYLPEKYKGMTVKSMPKNKINNITKDGISLFDDNSKRVLPVFYINDMYGHYRKTGDFKLVMQTAADSFVEGIENPPFKPGSAEDYVRRMLSPEAKENIVFTLVNTEQNRGMLSYVPNRSFRDLSVIYRWVCDINDDLVGSTIIRNDIADMMGLDEESLFKLARENTRRILPPSVENMNDVIRKILLKDKVPEEVIDIIISDGREDFSAWIITNERFFYGAANMMYDDVLQKLATDIESDLYILPSSVSEVIAVPAKEGVALKWLADMVPSVNREEVAPEERLSNQVYHYDRKQRMISLATDTQKSLDFENFDKADESCPEHDIPPLKPSKGR